MVNGSPVLPDPNIATRALESKERIQMTNNREIRKPIAAIAFVAISLCALSASADRKVYPASLCTPIDHAFDQSLHYSNGTFGSVQPAINGSAVNVFCPITRDEFFLPSPRGNTPSTISGASVLAQGVTSGSSTTNVSCSLRAISQSSAGSVTIGFASATLSTHSTGNWETLTISGLPFTSSAADFWYYYQCSIQQATADGSIAKIASYSVTETGAD
jgi:hypothetical protein